MINYFNKISFDGLLTGSNGVTIAADCQITPPLASGSPAEVLLRIKLPVQKHPTNPCSLRGKYGDVTIEIEKIWYSFFPIRHDGAREHESALIEILHIGSILQTVDVPTAPTEKIVFHLSPVNFFRKHHNSTLVRYSNEPSQRVELFRLKITCLGEVVFVKKWAIKHDHDNILSAYIYSGYYAEVSIKQAGVKNLEDILAVFQDALIMLSIISRQAIDVVGWEEEGGSINRLCWKDPLEISLAPYMPIEPQGMLCYPVEFENIAESIINGYILTENILKSRILELATTLAPHVKMQTSQRFLELYTGFERVVKLQKASKMEKIKISQSNAELETILDAAILQVDLSESQFKKAVSERLSGFLRTVGAGGLSFGAQLNLFKQKYSNFYFFSADLWPVEGSRDAKGLREIRNDLVHGSYDAVEREVLMVATLHFSTLIERLIFILVGAEVPEDINPNSTLLERNSWYSPLYWKPLRKK